MLSSQKLLSFLLSKVFTFKYVLYLNKDNNENKWNYDQPQRNVLSRRSSDQELEVIPVVFLSPDMGYFSLILI